MLLAAIVGSGIAAERLSPHEAGLELLENAVATAAALGRHHRGPWPPFQGAHLNPSDHRRRRGAWRPDRRRGFASYVVAQFAGAVVGAFAANLMFSLPAVEISTKPRFGPGLWFAEGVATFGLVLVVFH